MGVSEPRPERPAVGRAADGWTLEAIESKREQAESLRARRKQAVEAFDRDYVAIGRIVKATLRLSGHSEAARRIYTSAHCLNSASA